MNSGQPSEAAEGSRLDRELNELLQELRVLLVAVTVVFAFLLGVPFTVIFDRDAGDAERAIYFVAFLAAALSIVVLVVPGVWHRIRWRDHDKDMLLRSANRFTILGTVFAGLAVVAVVLLIAEFLYGWPAGIVVAGVIGLLVVVVWYGIPLTRELRDD